MPFTLATHWWIATQRTVIFRIVWLNIYVFNDLSLFPNMKCWICGYPWKEYTRAVAQLEAVLFLSWKVFNSWWALWWNINIFVTCIISEFRLRLQWVAWQDSIIATDNQNFIHCADTISGSLNSISCIFPDWKYEQWFRVSDKYHICISILVESVCLKFKLWRPCGELFS